MVRKRRNGRGWWGERYRHSLAAKKGWRKRKRHKKSSYASPKAPRVREDKGGLFKPPKHPDIAAIVSFETPSDASRSANILLAELQYTKDRQRALTIARALQYAGNRAEVSAHRKNLSEKERKELLMVAKIYKNAAQKGWDIYRRRFGE